MVVISLSPFPTKTQIFPKNPELGFLTPQNTEGPVVPMEILSFTLIFLLNKYKGKEKCCPYETLNKRSYETMVQNLNYFAFSMSG